MLRTVRAHVGPVLSCESTFIVYYGKLRTFLRCDHGTKMVHAGVPFGNRRHIVTGSKAYFAEHYPKAMR
jgi:hypothetical protein